MKITNKEVDPVNEACVDANVNYKWRCLMSQFLLTYIESRTFIIQSPYSKEIFSNILGIECTQNDTTTPCNDE